MDKKYNIGEVTLKEIVFKCEQCREENHSPVTEDMIKQDNFVLNCTLCNYPNEINSKQVIEKFKSEAAELAMKELKKMFK